MATDRGLEEPRFLYQYSGGIGMENMVGLLAIAMVSAMALTGFVGRIWR